jgi:hypothetical protein
VWGGRTRFDLPVGIRTSRLVRPTNRNERTPLCHQYLAAHFLALPCTTELIKQELGITTLPPLPFSRPYNTIRQKKIRMPVDHDSRTLPFQRNFDGQVRAHTHTKRISFPFPPLVGIPISVPTVTAETNGLGESGLVPVLFRAALIRVMETANHLPVLVPLLTT